MKDKIFEEIRQGLVQGLDYAQGKKLAGAKLHKRKIPKMPNLKEVRAKLGLSQEEFAYKFGFSTSTLRNWEQGSRIPDSSAVILLNVIAKSPKIVESVLQ